MASPASRRDVAGAIGTSSCDTMGGAVDTSRRLDAGELSAIAHEARGDRQSHRQSRSCRAD